MVQNKERMAYFARELRTYGRMKPSDHVNPTSPQRDALEGYAMASGMVTSLVGRATNTDLIGIWLVGDKDHAAASRMIRLIERRMSNGSSGPLGEPTDPAPPRVTPVPPRAPEPPYAPPGGPSVDVATIRRIARDEINATMGEALDDFGNAIKRDVDARLAENLENTRDIVGSAVSNLLPTVERLAESAVQVALKAMTPTMLVVQTPQAPPSGVNLGPVHNKTPAIIRALARGQNVYLHGPAGSGKTTVAAKCAEAFGLKFYFTGKLDSEYGLLGFATGLKDPNTGNVLIVRTQFREAYEHGGLFLFDEMDRSDASAVVAMNAALANGVCAFPDGIIKRHPDCKIIAAGNTVMSGASHMYQAAMQQDGSSIDRFAFIHFGYDEVLERALTDNQDWVSYVQSVRHACARRELDHLVTPRATIEGSKGLADGETWDDMADQWIWKGLDRDTVEQIKSDL